MQTRTTSFLVDDDVLIDCGTGVGDLPLDALLKIDHVFLTHAHLDHIASLPLLIDAVCNLRTVPLTVHATPETIRILHSHVFNWLVWPDFSSIPDRHQPFMRFQPMKVNETTRLGARSITALPARHTVPTVAYCLDSGEGKLVFSGDTAYCSVTRNTHSQMTRLPGSLTVLYGATIITTATLFSGTVLFCI